MGDFTDTRAVIEGRFASGWGSTTPVRWENAPFLPPAESPYVALFIRDGYGQPIALGPHPLHRFLGVVITQVFVAEGDGNGAARSLGDQVAAVWRDSEGRGVQLAVGTNGVLTFSTPYLEVIGARNGFWQANVSAPFTRDQIY